MYWSFEMALMGRGVLKCIANSSRPPFICDENPPFSAHISFPHQSIQNALLIYSIAHIAHIIFKSVFVRGTNVALLHPLYHLFIHFAHPPHSNLKKIALVFLMTVIPHMKKIYIRESSITMLSEYVNILSGKEYLELNSKYLRVADKSQAVGRGPRAKECAFWIEYLPQLISATG